jgi:Reverse transcriptase (RNA-dependent DNA polymerase)/GAG-pre-integrase domain/gag-polypeptide of LTR copia-type
MSGIPSLTILPEEQKFNGDNLMQWKTNIIHVLGSKGLLGYINGKIPKPTQPPTPPSITPDPDASATENTTPQVVATPTPTPIYSSTPTLDEWTFRDQLAIGHIVLNCTDVSSLGVKTTGTAKDAWDSIESEWGKSTDMRRSHAQEVLNRTVYAEGSEIQDHIKLLRNRKTALDNLSTTAMSDETWRGVIIRSIPPTAKWLPIIPSLYTMPSSADVVSLLLAHGMILGRDIKSTNTNSSSTALSARTNEGCTNPNCKAKKRSTHTTANCYWPGGGKEGQFPPNFGQRSKANAAATTTVNAATTTANTSTTPGQTATITEHIVLSARVPCTPGRSGVIIDGVIPTTPGSLIDHHSTILISKTFQSFGKGGIPTFLDSGASDTMFVCRDDFTEYRAVTPRMGDSAKAIDGSFEIVGEGNVAQRYRVNGKERDVTYTHALHAPALNANLISVSALDKAGITTTFGNGQGIARKSDGTIVLTGINVNGMYVLETVGNPHRKPLVAMGSLSLPTSLEQWHRRLAHCSPLTIKEMAVNNLVDGLRISEDKLTGKCEACILGRQTRRPFDGSTEKDLSPLELVSFDLWGPSRTQSVGGKSYLMIIVDGGTSYKYGAYLSDKSDLTTLAAFDIFRTKAETLTKSKLCRLRTDGAFDTAAWRDYTQKHGITHEITAPYSSAQNGLAERALRTTIDDVRTLLRDSGLSHSYWAEAAAHSIYTRNLIPSRRHPNRIPIEMFLGKRQDIAHLRVFGAKCWAKVPTVHGVQVNGGSKLDNRSLVCRLLGYAPGSGNYKVQELVTHRVFVSRDVVFEEGLPLRTLESTNVGEQTPIFDSNLNIVPTSADTTEANHNSNNNSDQVNPDNPTINLDHDHMDPDQQDPVDQQHAINIPPEPRRSTRAIQPSQARIDSTEYKQRELVGKGEGQAWATNRKNPQANYTRLVERELESDIDRNSVLACLTETKASHHIPRSYKHAMTTDPDRWMIPMQIEIDTLKAKHTWDLVKAPPGTNIMGSMWVYDIKWDGEGKRIKDKARLVGKGYTQQLGVDYNETWAGVTRLESVRMTAAVAAKLDLKLWRIDFVGAYLNSLTKEDIYMKQPEGFVEAGKEDHVCKLVHTIYGTMQGGHDWYETLDNTYNELGYKGSRADPCVRFKKEHGNYTLTDTYTDDVFGASNNDEEIKKRKEEMGRIWDIKDVGENDYFLGMRVQQDLHLGTIRLTQRPYWEHVLNRFELGHVTPRNTPLPVGIVLDNEMLPKTSSERTEMINKPYRAILGSIMWGQLATRPDLSFSVSLLARFQANPGINHWSALIHVVGYIKNTLDYGLTYSRDFSLSPTAFVDADYGGCKDTRRSTSGYIFMMAGGPVSWSSKRQATVALSTVEAEYVAMSRCAQQMAWMQSWLNEIEIQHSLPGLIKGDNRGAIALTKNTRDHGKVKHIDIRHHYIRELVHSGSISIEQVASADNLADLFTKPLPRDHHHRLLVALNIH